MARAKFHGHDFLRGMQQLSRFREGLGAQLPDAYRRFWAEWKLTAPATIQFVSKYDRWICDEITGEVLGRQSGDQEDGLDASQSPSPKPLSQMIHARDTQLRRSVLYSRILDEFISLAITERTMQQIHECRGLDHYLLKYPACVLRSTLALRLKRKILTEMMNGCPKHETDPELQSDLIKEYNCYLECYTPEDVDWYGYTFSEAIEKLQNELRVQHYMMTYRLDVRKRLLEHLQQTRDREAASRAMIEKTIAQCKLAKDEDEFQTVPLPPPTSAPTPTPTPTPPPPPTPPSTTMSFASLWLSKINPFSKK